MKSNSLSPTRFSSPAAQASTAPPAGPTAAAPVPDNLPVRRPGVESGVSPAHRRTTAALPQAAAATTATPSPAPEIQAGQVVPLPRPPGRETALPAEQAQALVMAEKIANQKDFGLPLALAADNYADLHRCLGKVYGAAEQFHQAWRTTRDRGCLAAAQGLDIRSALLNGLYTIRLLHKDWLSRTPFTSPESLAHVLPLFRHALHLCETRSDAVQFPIEGLQPALAHLHQQIEASRQSLEAGQWHATAEGQWYAQRHDMALARGEPDLQSWPALTQAPDALPPPFDGLADQCRHLSLTVERLQAVLAEGPAARQAGQRSFKSALSTSQPAAGSPAVAARQLLIVPRLPVSGARTPAPARTAPPRPAATAARTAPSAPAIKTRASQAPRHGAQRSDAVDPPFHGGARAPAALAMMEPVAPPETAAMASPAVDPAEAARLQQERMAALQAGLDQLLAEAGRREASGPASGTSGVAAAPAWARHAREFDAWEAHGARAEALAAQASDLSGSSGEPAVERLQQAIDAASRQALKHAAETAQATLAHFAQACDKAIVHGDLKEAGVASYAELAKHCHDLQTQWQTATLRPGLQELEMRMALYGAYEAACATIGTEPGSAAGALNMADRLKHAAHIAQRVSGGAQGDLAATLGAFHRFCEQKRNDLLRTASRMQADAIDTTRAASAAALTPVLPRSLAVSAAYDVLLVGKRLSDPLPDDWDREPDRPSGSASPGPVQVPSAGPDDDLSLAQTAREVEARACRQHQGALELPADAPARAAHDLKARLVLLRQTELTARTAAAAIGRFHELSAALDSAKPIDRPALLERHAGDMKQLATDLHQASQALDGVAKPSLAAEVRDLLNRGKTQLRADQRLVERMEMSLRTLKHLLKVRVQANRNRRSFAQEKLSKLLQCPEVSGHAHERMVKEFKEDVQQMELQLQNEPHATTAERESLRAAEMGLRTKIESDRLLIQTKLLLAWGEAALQWKSMPGQLRQSDAFAPLRRVAVNRSQVLANITEALMAHAKSFKHKETDNGTDKDPYQDQLAVNDGIQGRLRELIDKLDTMQASGSTAGSSNPARVSAAQLVAGHGGKPSRHSRPGRRR